MKPCSGIEAGHFFRMGLVTVPRLLSWQQQGLVFEQPVFYVRKTSAQDEQGTMEKPART